MSVWISLIPSLYRRRVSFFVLFPPFLRPPHLIHTWSISNSSRRCFSSVYKSLRVSSPLQFRTDYPRNISLISIGIEVKHRGRIITRGSSHFEPIKKIVFIENPKVHRVRYVDDTRYSVRIYFWTFYSYRHRFHPRPFVTTTFDMFIAPAIILLSMPVEIEEAEFHNKFLQEIRATE